VWPCAFWGASQLWDLATGVALCSIEFPAPLRAVALDPLDALLAVGTDTGTVVVVDLYSRPGLPTADGTALTARPLSASLRAARPLSAALEQPASKADTSGPRVLTGHSGAITSVAFAAEGALLISGSQDGTLAVWDVVYGQQLRLFQQHKGTEPRRRVPPFDAVLPLTRGVGRPCCPALVPGPVLSAQLVVRPAHKEAAASAAAQAHALQPFKRAVHGSMGAAEPWSVAVQLTAAEASPASASASRATAVATTAAAGESSEDTDALLAELRSENARLRALNAQLSQAVGAGNAASAP